MLFYRQKKGIFNSVVCLFTVVTVISMPIKFLPMCMSAGGLSRFATRSQNRLLRCMALKIDFYCSRGLIVRGRLLQNV